VSLSFGESHRLESNGLKYYTGTSKQHVSSQDAQKVLPASPQPKNRPQAYPLGYVEDLFEVRTKLGDFFSILLKGSAVTVPHLSRHIVELRQMHDSLGHFLS
jgi:hypothetical protein